MNLDLFDRALNKAPYILIWLVVVIVTASVATQTYMYMERKHAGLESAPTVIAGNGQYAPHEGSGLSENGL